MGPNGRAIGIDMTPEMIERARRNAAGIDNAEFHLAGIDALPLPDASADVIISNCVINLAPDKAAMLREAYRVLKPGGRLAVSDVALRRELPPELAESVAAYVGCVAGAITVAEYERLLREAGFAAAQVIDSGADLRVYEKVEGASGRCSPAADGAAAGALGCCGAAPGAPAADVHEGLADLLGRHDVNDYAGSFKVLAVKPA